MKFDELPPEERAVYEWQYRMCGGFTAALWEAIARADTYNLAKLRRAFPVEVDGFIAFSTIDGWWPAVDAKVQR